MRLTPEQAIAPPPLPSVLIPVLAADIGRAYRPLP